jgi:phospholipid/cholesterol/gamma-HCH transport system ATP-binding protein
VIAFRNICKSFGSKTVLSDVSFDVQDGEVLFIIGASGVGKSVLIKHLVGLLSPDEGEIWLDGEEISKKDEIAMYPVRKKCAMVFQHSTLFDSMTCVENVSLPLRKHKGLGARDALAEARRRLEIVRMEEFADRYPAELGDGMRKRVAIARALVTEPEVVFLDEPTTGLDPQSRRELWDLIEGFRAAGRTVLLTTHYMEEAERLCDRVAVVDHGKIIAQGSPAELVAKLNAPYIVEFASEPALAQGDITSLPGIRDCRHRDLRWFVSVASLVDAMPALLARLDRGGAKLLTLSTHQATLEDVFISLTGRQLRDD